MKLCKFATTRSDLSNRLSMLSGSPEDAVRMAKLHTAENEPFSALRRLYDASDRGSHEADFLLGVMYFVGLEGLWLTGIDKIAIAAKMGVRRAKGVHAAIKYFRNMAPAYHCDRENRITTIEAGWSD